MEKLNKLPVSIFDIQSENDVFKVNSLNKKRNMKSNDFFLNIITKN